MSTPLVINGTTYNYPEVGDIDWGIEANEWASAVTTGMLQKAGGLFQLLSETDFGSSYGTKSLYYKSRTSNPASTGQIRLARADSVSWRNQGNDGDLDLSVNSSNQLTFEGVPVVGSEVLVSDTDSINLTLDVITLSADLNLSSTAADSGSLIVDLEIKDDGLHGQITQSSIASVTSAMVVPTGGIVLFAGAVEPTGFLLCNGSAVSRSTYSALYSVIADAFGEGDGATTFNVPDMRGRFPRGRDRGTGRDPDAASRTASNTGGNTGDALGSIQDGTYESHTHTQDSHNHTQNSHNHTQDSHNHTQDIHAHSVVDDGHGHNWSRGSGGVTGGSLISGNGTPAGTATTGIATATTGVLVNPTTSSNQAATATNQAITASNQATTATNQNSGGDETRPINIYLDYLIKY